jgi:hypothetical protein
MVIFPSGILQSFFPFSGLSLFNLLYAAASRKLHFNAPLLIHPVGDSILHDDSLFFLRDSIIISVDSNAKPNVPSEG